MKTREPMRTFIPCCHQTMAAAKANSPRAILVPMSMDPRFLRFNMGDSPGASGRGFGWGGGSRQAKGLLQGREAAQEKVPLGFVMGEHGGAQGFGPVGESLHEPFEAAAVAGI